MHDRFCEIYWKHNGRYSSSHIHVRSYRSAEAEIQGRSQEFVRGGGSAGTENPLKTIDFNFPGRGA